jgi:carboxyvinyl-carboxyphosphonate phosphorylmutase
MDERILVMPGAQDALTAKIIEQAGFKAIILGGYSVSASILGQPDVGMLTLTEMADQAKNIIEAVDIPVLVDGDTGHGGITNVIRTVQEFEKAGAAGILIEDQVFPKRCGHMEGKQVIEPEEMVPKIKAAIDTRTDADLVIVARTDARAVYGLENAILRAKRYEKAGADLIFIEAPQNEAEIVKINTEVKAPTLANMVEGGKTPQFTAAELEDMGFSAVAFPVSSLYATAWAVRSLMEELNRTGSTRGCSNQMVSFNDFNQLIGLEKIREIEARYQKK